MNLQRRSSALLREEVLSTTLECGLPVHVVPKRGFARKAAVLAARYGSVDLAFEAEGRGRVETPHGVAHFLEHQLFKKAGGEDVLMEFGRYGASSNAFTDYGTTAYYFVTTDDFDKSLDLLVRFVTAPYFEAANVAKEKLIIEQELRMYEDYPDHRLYRNLMAALYQKNPVRIDIGGTVESIQGIDRDVLERCYKTFYNPANLTLVVTGDLDPTRVMRKVRSLLPSDRFHGLRPIERRLPKEPEGVREREVRAKMEISRARVLLGFKDPEIDPREILKQEMEMSAVLDLLFGRGSAFYTRWYEKGLIDDSFSASYNLDTAYGFSLIGGETDRPEALVDAVSKELRKVRFKKKDVERAKKKRLGRFLRSFDSADETAFLVLGAVQHGIDLFSVPQAIAALSPRALEDRVRRHFDDRNCAVSILSPKAGNNR